MPPDRLVHFVRSGAETAEVDVLAREVEDPFVLEEIIRSHATGDETLLHLARTAGGRPQEALISNHARLLAEPGIIQALLDNPALTSEGRRLLSELTEEFFEKRARRLRAEESAARPATAADDDAPGWAEESEDPGDETDLEEGEEEGPAVEDATPKTDEENSLFIGAMYRRIGLMTISEKIKLAYTGSKEERHILIGDANKLVGLAVLKSRAITINEAESFAGMRNLDEEIYRRISWNREWMRKPAVVIALVRNPRVPLDITLPLLKRLSVRELRAVFRDRNLQTVLRATARRFLVQKRR
jgi:hypothetical protein